MKKLYVLILLLFISVITFSQVKIGNNPENISDAALLELESENKGLLISKIELDNTSDWTLNGVPVEGMLIFNETGFADKGFYYWDDILGEWLKVLNKSELQNLDNDDQLIQSFIISGTELLLEIENGGGEKKVSFLELLGNEQFVTVFADSLLDNSLFQSGIQQLILANSNQLTESEVDAFVSDNGYLTSEVDGDATNEIQTISRSGLTVTLSDGGGTFQDSILSETAVDAMVSDNGYLTGFTETDPTVSALVKSIDASDTTRWGTDTNTQLTESEVDAFVSDNGYLTSEVDGDATNEIQTISRSGLTVTLSDGGGTFQDSILSETAVDAMVSDNGYLTGFTETDPTVSALVKSIDAADTTRWGIDTNTQLTESEVDAFVSDNGYLTSEVDGDATNEIQTISRSGLTVTLSDGGGTFQDSILSETAVDAMVSDNGYLTSEVDGDATNEIQTISRSGLTVTLSDGGGTFQDSILSETAVDVMVSDNGYLTSYTETDPTVSALVKSIDAADTTRWGIDTNTQLTESEVDAFVSDNGYLTSEVDGDATNELQTISRSGLTVTLSDGGGTFQDSILSETAVDAMVSDNGYLTSEVDGDATNEIQTISRSGLTVTLSDGGGTFQDSILSETAVDAMVSDNGYLTGFTETDPTVSALVKSIDAADTTRWGIDTNTQLTESEVDAFVSDNGYLISEVDGDATNEIQTISRSGLTVTLSDGGGTFQDSILSETAVDAMVSDNGYLTSFTETDPTVSALVKSIDAADTTRWGTDTNTQLTESEVDAFVSDNGYLTSEVDGDATNEIQTISRNGLTVTLSDGGGTFQDSILSETAVDAMVSDNGYLTSFTETDPTVSALVKSIDAADTTRWGIDTNTQLTESEVDAFVSDNGYLTSEVDGDATNEIQTISRSGLTVTLSDGGGTFQDSILSETAVDAMVSDNGYLTGFTETDPTVSALVKSIDAADTTRWGIDTNTQLTESEVDAFVSDNGYLTLEVDGDATNEIQTISRSGLTVTLSDGGGTFQDSILSETAVDAMVSDNGYLTGFTETDPTVSALVKSIDAADTTRWGIDTNTQLTESEVDAFVSDNGYLTLEVDGDATNEIQTISRSGLTVTLSDGGGTFQDSILSETAVDAMVSDNGYLTSEVDGDATNEIQTISRSGLTVTLSDGGGTFQDSILSETAVDDMVSDNGYLTSEVDGNATNELQTLAGDITSTGTTTLTTTIGNDKVLERHLKAVNTPTDEYVLTYEQTTGDFEWQEMTGGSSTSVYGEIYSVTAPFSTSTTFQSITTFTAGLNSGVTVSSSGMTIVTTGIYRVSYSASFSASNNGKVISSSMFNNSAELTKIGWERKINSAGDVGSVAASGIISLTSGNVLTIRIKQDSGPSNTDITFNKINVSIHKL